MVYWAIIRVIICLVVGFAQALAEAPAQEIKVIFRYDDFSQKSDLVLERCLLKLFEKYEIPITVGVIPFVCAGNAHDPIPQPVLPLSNEKAQILSQGLEKGLIEVALHGYTHQTREGKTYTEFRDAAFHEQMQRIKEGKEFLENMVRAKIVTFIPPWNTYDYWTTVAIDRLNFEILSAGRYAEPYGVRRIRYLPATCDLRNIYKAMHVISTPGMNLNEPIVIILFHPYDFLESGDSRAFITLSEMEELISRLTRLDRVSFSTLRDAGQSASDLSLGRLVRNSPLIFVGPIVFDISAIVERIRNRNGTQFLYLDQQTASKYRTIGGGLYCLSSMAVCVCAALGVSAVRRHTCQMRIDRLFRIMSPLVAALLMIYLFTTLTTSFISFRTSLLVAVLLGSCVGLWRPDRSISKKSGTVGNGR